MSIVHISGRIGRDAEVRKVGDNDVCNFSVAENIGFGANKKTQWWACALWGTRGEKLAPYLAKGSAVTVCGEVTVREYNAKDGTPKWELTCRVMDVALQGSREDGAERSAAPAQQAQASAPASAAVDDFDEPLPF
jgi:single-strand DNA-binding protein